MAQFQRQTAIPCYIKDILEGEWLELEDSPNGVKTSRGLISRANIMGVIVDKPTPQTILVEDGTGRLTIRTFDSVKIFENISVGQFLLIIGRPREYNNDKYLVAEICKPHSTTWADYRKKELELLSKVGIPDIIIETPPPKEEIAEVIKVPDVGENPFEKIIALIRELDSGNGAPVGEILEKISEGEKFINTLIEEGEIFEVKPGRVKVLE